MKRGLRLLTVLAAVLLLGSGFTLAQDSILQRYESALDYLQRSVVSLGTDAVESRDLLDSAAASLRTLAPDTTSPNLIRDMEQVFVRARTAIQNRSHTDLAVQTAVLRGGYQRAVLESALALAQTDLSAARSRLASLAELLTFDGDGQAQIAAAADLRQLRTAFDSAAARNIAGKLQLLAEASAPAADIPGTYIQLADAYGQFLHIQDAPDVPAHLNARFMTLINNLVAGEVSELPEGTAELAATFAELGALQELPPQTAAPAEDPAASAETVAAEPAGEAATEPAAPVVEEPAAEAVAEATMEEAAGEAAALEPEMTAPTEASATTVGPAAAEELLLARQAEEERATLQSGLARMGLRGQQGEAAARELQAEGFGTVDQVFDRLYAVSAQLVSSAAAGDQPRSSTLLGEFDRLYRATLAAPAVQVRPTAHASMLELISTLRASNSVVRLPDIQLLISQLEVLQSPSGASPGLLDETQLTVGKLVTGWPRLAVTLLAALLAIIPLVLLNMAFGGGKRNWQLINTGILFLLLPVIFEGLTYLTDLLAGLTRLDWLLQPGRFSLFQNPLTQSIWLVLTFIAILLMSAGLYGICVQFGLFGRARSSETVQSSGQVEAKTLIGWDEEF